MDQNITYFTQNGTNLIEKIDQNPVDLIKNGLKSTKNQNRLSNFDFKNQIIPKSSS